MRWIAKLGLAGALMAGSAAAGTAVPLVAAPAGAATGLTYVALGDSYTAAPNDGALETTISPLCLQYSANYPHKVAATLGASLTDASCSGATTGDMTSSQYPGVAPQFASLSPSTRAVTIGIGGNDNNTFVGAIVSCFATDSLDFLNIGSPCKSAFGTTYVHNVNVDGPTIGAALQQIHALAPSAKVFVVGYPDILPQKGNCYPTIPLTSGDVSWLNQLELTLNGVLRSEAAANGATYVDTYSASIGHAACTSSGTRWVEPVVSGSSGIILHPNTNGEAADTTEVLAAFAAAGLG